MFDDHGTFRVAFPRDAAQIEATYRRGPEPTPIDTRLTGDRLSLAVPLTPGGNQIQIKASVPWREGLIVPVGASLDIAEWSLLTAPEGLEVEALELEAGATDVPGFARFTGPSLNADRNFELRLQFKAGPAPTTEDVFTRGTPAADAGADRKGEGGGVGVLPFVFGGVLIIIVIAAAARRRG